jgi:UDP-glucose 4-epimerase
MLGKGDIIIHLAATVGVKKVFQNSYETAENNLAATELILKLAQQNACRIFYASTSEVYGQSNKQLLEETDPLMVHVHHKGRSAYVLSKLLGEHHCLNYFENFGLPVIIGRFFNVIGPRQQSEFGMVVPTFTEQALAHAPMTLFQDGSQKRSFCFVKDAVNAILSLIHNEAAWGNIFNIGSGTTITIKQLAEYIQAATQSASEIHQLPMPPERSGNSEIYSRTPDLHKIKSFTNWTPTTPWEKAVDTIIQHRREVVKNEKQLAWS